MAIFAIGASVTGQHSLYNNQVQAWAQQSAGDRSIECYCIDAPDFIATGSVTFEAEYHGVSYCISDFKHRDSLEHR